MYNVKSDHLKENILKEKTPEVLGKVFVDHDL